MDLCFEALCKTLKLIEVPSDDWPSMEPCHREVPVETKLMNGIRRCSLSSINLYTARCAQCTVSTIYEAISLVLIGLTVATLMLHLVQLQYSTSNSVPRFA